MGLMARASRVLPMVCVSVARPTAARHCLNFVSPIAVLTPQRRNFFGFSKTNEAREKNTNPNFWVRISCSG